MWTCKFANLTESALFDVEIGVTVRINQIWDTLYINKYKNILFYFYIISQMFKYVCLVEVKKCFIHNT